MGVPASIIAQTTGRQTLPGTVSTAVTPAAAPASSAAPTLPSKLATLPQPATTGAFTVSASPSQPDTALAALTRAQYSYFQNKAKPSEDAAIAGIVDPNTSANVAATARNEAAAAFDATRGMEERNLSRFGYTPTGDATRSINRRFGLDRALTIAGAGTAARNTTDDVQTALAGDALSIGRNIAGQATGNLSDAASLATSRKSYASQAASAKRSSTIGTVASGAGIGAAIGGPVGGAVGAGIGLLASFLF